MQFHAMLGRWPAARFEFGMVAEEPLLIEEWVGTAPLFPTMHQIMMQRVDACPGNIGIVPEIKSDGKMQRGIEALLPSHMMEVMRGRRRKRFAVAFR